MSLLHDLLLITSYDIDRVGMANILDFSMRYKLHTVRPSRITPSLFDDLGPEPIGLIDVELQEADPVVVASELIGYRPRLPLLFMVRTESPQIFLRGLRVGVLGLIQKTEQPDAILRKLDSAIQRQSSCNGEELRRFQTCFTGEVVHQAEKQSLTLRESEVLRKLSLGTTNRKIADELGISYETVKEHVQHILRKIGVNDRTQAAVWAVRKKLF
ncbi:MAG: response regulator transcription factor [Pirellula sp.]